MQYGGYMDRTPTKTKRFLLSIKSEALLRERYGITEMRREGDELRMKCPLVDGNHKHGDTTGKFSLNTKKNIWHCWVDGGGDIVDLVKRMETDADGKPIEVSDEDALLIAKSFSRELTDDEFEKLLADEMLDRTGEDWGHPQPSDLSNHIAALAKNKHPYWSTRGFTDETCEMWRLGYDPRLNRVSLPHMFNRKWMVVQKRTLEDTIWSTGPNPPKWKNSEDFPKQETLFNYDRAKQYDTVVVVEAAVSAIYLWQCGIPNVVSTFSAKPSEEQMTMLRSFENVIIWYDPDPAGWTGTEALINGLFGHVDTWVVNHTDSGDPNEVSRGVLRHPQDVWDTVNERGLIPSYLWTRP